jgi:prephenate dehydrogenase
MNHLEGRTITVYGGAGGWGKKIAETVTPKAKRVLIVDPKLGKDSADRKEAAAQSDILFFSVSPDHVTNEIYEAIKEVLKDDQSVMDCATTKSSTTDTLYKMDEQGLSVCSTHPMCRPDLPTRGQNTLLMPVGKNYQRALLQAIEIFEALEMRVSQIRFETHRDVSAVVQGTPHAVGRVMIHALAAALKKAGLTLPDLNRLGTANLVANAIGTGRVAIQPGGISASILCEVRETEVGKAMLQNGIELFRLLQTASSEELERIFNDDIDEIDPTKSWRRYSLRSTNVVLSRLGNLRKESFTIRAKKNRPGLLSLILILLHKQGIDLTAIDSNTEIPEVDCEYEVEFDLGIKYTQNMDWKQLQEELDAIECAIINRDSTIEI